MVFSVIFPDELREALDEIAARECTSTGAVVRRLVLTGLRVEGHGHPARSTR